MRHRHRGQTSSQDWRSRASTNTSMNCSSRCHGSQSISSWFHGSFESLEELWAAGSWLTRGRKLIGLESCVWRQVTVLTASQASKLREVPAADGSDRAHRCKTADNDLLVVDQVNLDIVVGGKSSDCVDLSCLDCRMLGGASSNTSHKTFVAPNRAAGQ